MADHGMNVQLGVASGEESPTAVPAGALGPDGAEREHAEQQAAADDGDLRPVTSSPGRTPPAPSALMTTAVTSTVTRQPTRRE
jgi:hypothetical protein